jgi:hypothetical protein
MLFPPPVVSLTTTNFSLFMVFMVMWRWARIPPSQSLRVVRGDRKEPSAPGYNWASPHWDSKARLWVISDLYQRFPALQFIDPSSRQRGLPLLEWRTLQTGRLTVSSNLTSNSVANPVRRQIRILSGITWVPNGATWLKRSAHGYNWASGFLGI